MTIAFKPEKISFEDLHLPKFRNGGQFIVKKQINPAAAIDCFAVLKPDAKKLICLLPSAQKQGSPRLNPVFHRWSWALQFPDASVLCFSDPGLYYSNLQASWFLSPDKTDLIAELAEFIRSCAGRLGIGLHETVLYGSSMGGFGALMIAAHIEGSMAIAEVPQLDLRKYNVRSAISGLERDFFHSRKIGEYFSENPARISVIERFLSTGNVPAFRIITNEADPANQEHLDLPSMIKRRSRSFNRVGDMAVIQRSDSIGHAPLPATIAIECIEMALLEGWKQRTQLPSMLPKAADDQSPSYKEVLAQAISVCNQIKFTRTPDDCSLYEEAKSLLLNAASMNQRADWPLLKLCNITRLWTNRFDTELLDAARNALSRKFSLEALIYSCRGISHNYDVKVALREIREMMDGCQDRQIANVANIFIGSLEYEIKNFKGYADAINAFKASKDAEFNPYIADPVATVLTDTAPLEAVDSAYEPHLLGKKLNYANGLPADLQYIISASCDLDYFSKYGEFLVKSFSQICGREAALHLSFTHCDPRVVQSSIDTWGGINVFAVSQDFARGQNEGAIASLLKFCSLPHILRTYNVPVFVLDLACVITKSMLPIVERFNQADVCSRILGKGVAPWDKYSGDFALFYPTRSGMEVANGIAMAGQIQATCSAVQWKLDQNCLEAGIRVSMQKKGYRRIVNFSNFRSFCCVMPAGSFESKRFQLKKALAGFEGRSDAPKSRLVRSIQFTGA